MLAGHTLKVSLEWLHFQLQLHCHLKANQGDGDSFSSVVSIFFRRKEVPLPTRATSLACRKQSTWKGESFKHKMMESGLPKWDSFFQRSLWNLRGGALHALGSKTLLPFHGQATVNHQHDPGYFGRLGILFISPPATMCAKCSAVFVTGSSTHPGAFLLP